MRLLIFLFILSCDQSNNFNKIKTDQELISWKSDKFGCKGIRTEENALRFVDTYKIRNSSKDHLITVFGEPNKISKSKSGKIIIYAYYYQSDCDDNNFLDSKDFCWMEIDIGANDKLVKSINFWCK